MTARDKMAALFERYIIGEEPGTARYDSALRQAGSELDDLASLATNPETAPAVFAWLVEAGVLTDGSQLIATERQRQLNEEGWTPEHDDEHTYNELVRAAYCYLREIDAPLPKGDVSILWPWDGEWWKPSADPIPNLVRAGALVAAEIDRIQRARQERP